MRPVIRSARFDPGIRFKDMSSMSLLHIAQLMDIGAIGVHRIQNGREVLVIRIERWPDGDVYVRRVSERFNQVSGVPICVPDN